MYVYIHFLSVFSHTTPSLPFPLVTVFSKTGWFGKVKINLRFITTSGGVSCSILLHHCLFNFPLVFSFFSYLYCCMFLSLEHLEYRAVCMLGIVSFRFGNWSYQFLLHTLHMRVCSSVLACVSQFFVFLSPVVPGSL